jgi:predicted dinucleotide-binding enzyme
MEFDPHALHQLAVKGTKAVRDNVQAGEYEAARHNAEVVVRAIRAMAALDVKRKEQP